MAQPLFQIRNTIKSSLTPLVSERDRAADLDYLIKITQALVSTNEEIWERCKANLDKEPMVADPGCEGEGNGLTFVRTGFNEVTVETTPDNWLIFKTLCEIEYEDFSITPFPEELSNIIPPRRRVKKEEAFINYKEYLQYSFLLEETVLLPFLAILKDHLEKIQADLGAVETWIMGSTRSISFLQETFSTVLEIKTQNMYNKETCNEFCLRCGYDFEDHKGINTPAARNGLDKDMKEFPAICSDGVDEQGIFVQKSETILKRVETMDSHNISFDVSCRSEQKSLIKFLQYVESLGEEK